MTNLFKSILPLFLIVSFSLNAQFGKENYITRSLDFLQEIEFIDVNKDGKVDLLGASSVDNKIFVYKNIGSGQFSEQVDISDSVAEASHLALADIDGDGDVDVLSASSSKKSPAWYPNDGSGNFGEEKPMPTLGRDVRNLIKCADFDKDGDIDVIAMPNRAADSTFWYSNDGVGNFTPVFLIKEYDTPKSISLADLDSDTYEDIVVVLAVYGGYSIRWMKNNGNGTFAPLQSIYLTGKTISNFLIFDVNNDNYKDFIFSTTNTENIYAMQGNGDGTFQTATTVCTSCASTISCLSEVDVNKDGKLDILALISDSPRVLWFENNGTFSFPTRHYIYSLPFISSYPRIIKGADVDSDGDIDIVTDDMNLSYFENKGNNTTFASTTIYSGVGEGTGLILVDSDGDGDRDIVSPTAFKQGVKLLENAGGSFKKAKKISTTKYVEIGYNGNMGVGDINNDMKPDIICPAVTTVFSLKNIGGNSFFEEEICPVGGPFDVGDFDNDNDVDVVRCGDVLLNDGNPYYGGFTRTGLPLPAVGCAKSKLSDIDSDGKLDLVAGSNEQLVWIKNIGGGVLSPNYTPINVNEDVSIYSYNIQDLNLDGFVDVLVYTHEYGTNCKLGWYANDGSGNFSALKIIDDNQNFFHSSSHAILLADLDGDKDQDLILNNYSTIYWYERIGAEQFGSAKVLKVGASSYSTCNFDDIDGDGDLDLLAGSKGELFWCENYFISPFQVKGNLFYDENRNGVMDTLERPLSFAKVYSDPVGEIAFTSFEGRYVLASLSECNEIKVDSIPNWSLVSDSASYTVCFDETHLQRDSLNFGFAPDSIYTDFSLSLTAGFPRCNSNVVYWPSWKNIGTTIPQGKVELVLDTALQFISSRYLQPDTVGSNKLVYSFDSLYFFSELNDKLILKFPDVSHLGDTLVSYLNVFEVNNAGDTLSIWSDTLSQKMLCAYDPNDKAVFPEGDIKKGQLLEYTVRFQNTGNDTAFTVVIKDTLSPKVNFSSFKLLSSSDPVKVNLSKNGVVTFSFIDIMLPDSATNLIESQGFVKYSIEQNSNVKYGDEIKNTAFIYFDANPAIVTNTVNSLLSQGNLSVAENSYTKVSSIKVFPNPVSEVINIVPEFLSMYSIEFVNVLGEQIYYNAQAQGPIKFDFSSYADGLYVCKIVEGASSQTIKVVLRR